jgi:hypothetical protein
VRLAAAVGILIWVRAILSGPAPLVGREAGFGPRHRASGVLHVHTNLSDGRGTPAEVVAAGGLGLVATSLSELRAQLRGEGFDVSRLV